jgi:hypothetical protein
VDKQKSPEELMHCSVKIMSYMSQKLDLSNDVDLGFNYEPHNLDQGYVINFMVSQVGEVTALKEFLVSFMGSLENTDV